MQMRVRERLLSIRLLERSRKHPALAEHIVLSAKMTEKPAAEKCPCARNPKKP